MSARVETYLDCDHPSCVVGWGEKVSVGEHVAEARARLAKEGWLSVRSRGIQDYCPLHASEHRREVKK